VKLPLWQRPKTILLCALLAGLLASPAAHAEASCSREQKKDLERFFEGRTVTAKIGLPLVNYPGGMWVFWNGDYDLGAYAEALRMGPVAIVAGQSAPIKKIKVNKKYIQVWVNGAGLHYSWKGPYQMSAAQAYKNGSKVYVSLGGGVIDPAFCNIETMVRALVGVMDISGASQYLEPVQETTPDLPQAIAGTEEDSSVQEATDPQLMLVSAEVSPTRIRPGESIELTVYFRVEGLAASQVMEITELRQLYLSDQALFSVPRSTTGKWGNGLHHTSLEMTIPGKAEPGVYTFAITLESSSNMLSKDALFVVSGE
jgi:hypothetical protein